MLGRIVYVSRAAPDRIALYGTLYGRRGAGSGASGPAARPAALASRSVSSGV